MGSGTSVVFQIVCLVNFWDVLMLNLISFSLQRISMKNICFKYFSVDELAKMRLYNPFLKFKQILEATSNVQCLKFLRLSALQATELVINQYDLCHKNYLSFKMMFCLSEMQLQQLSIRETVAVNVKPAICQMK